MSQLALFLLGSPRIERDGEPVEISRRKAIALIAYLAMTTESHPRDALATLLWPRLNQARARAALRRTLFTLKNALGEKWFDVKRESLTLKRGDGFWLDVECFRDLLAACRRHGHPADETCPVCLTSLTEAVALYRDDFMTRFSLCDSESFDDWRFFQSQRLRRELSRALEKLVCAHSAWQAFEPAIAHARRWLALDPLHEPAHRHLMQLYAQAGQRAAALRQYRKCVQALQRELGVPPQEETTWLHQAIRRSRQPLPGDLTPARRSHRLPQQPTSFVGRADELAEADWLLQHPDCRLLTLVGPGGVGKTRLAIQAAAAKLDAFPHGVHFVSLASLDSADLLVSTIAQALAFPLRGGAEPKAQLLDYLREKDMLLVLDNFEHLFGGVGLLVEILESAPGVKLLVTSRERLALQWEWPLEVRGLKFPQDAELAALEDYDAVQLFLQRASQMHPGFALAEEERPFVGHLCQFLEGLPLGIELAAAWVHVFSCREIVHRIEHRLGSLTTVLRDVPERHRSLQAVFEPTWDLLSAEEKSIFSKLSVFRGGFWEEAAEKVVDASLPLLLALVRKSLLRRSYAGRYSMLEVLRQYAEEKLCEAPQEKQETHDRHCEYYATFLHQREDCLRGRREKEALEEIEREIENVRAAWRWAVECGKVEAIGKSLESLYLFYDRRGWFQEGEEALEKAVAGLGGLDGIAGEAGEKKVVVLGRLFARQGWLCQRQPRLEKARELSQISLSIFRSLGVRRETAFSLNVLGVVTWRLGEYAEARQMLEESLSICRESGDRWGTALRLTNLGVVANKLGEYTEAKQRYRESLAIFKDIGDQWGTAACLTNLGNVAQNLGEYQEAKRLFQEGLTIFTEIGNHGGTVACLTNLGNVSRILEEYTEAKRLLEESLAVRKEVGDQRGIAGQLGNLGLVAEALGEYREAKQLYRECLAIFGEIGDRWGMANNLNNLGFVLCMLEEHQAARECFDQALETAVDIQAIPVALGSLVGMAMLLARGEREKKEQAVELVAHALDHPSTVGVIKDRAKQALSELESLLEPQAFAKALERGKARSLEYFVRAHEASQLGA